MDHLCYRTGSQEEYMDVKTELSTMGHLLVESLVGGRLIATYKLHNRIPLILRNGASVYLQVIEVPSPKPGRNYASGLEHVEFVVPDLHQWQASHPLLQWDVSALIKKINPDLRLAFDGFSVKFHTQSLEKVIAMELAGE